MRAYPCQHQVAHARAWDQPDEDRAVSARGRRRNALIDHALQAAILVLSAAAIWLVAQPVPLQRWGFLIGLVSQPFWFVTTWRKRQWGMFALSIFYTGAWVQGIGNHF